jgi:3-deoxy-D-manno-octulosonic-acid transferase
VSDPLTLHLYRLATHLAAPALPWYLRRRIKAGKEDPTRISERFGTPGKARPPGPLVWLHGASVGELVSILPLAEGLVGRGFGVLVTTGTTTSAEVAASRLPQGVIHQFVPVDTPAATEKFVAHWRPDLAIFAESELWPNLIRAAKAGGARLAIVNGRMSERSLKGWSRHPGFIRALLRRFDLVLGQTGDDAARYALLGAAGASSAGNIKFDAPPLPVDEAELARLKAALAGRPVFVAASTHPGEEEIVVATHLKVAAEVPGLVTVIAPRHPERGEAISTLAQAAGLPIARRSQGAAISGQTQLYIADTVGEMGLVYRLGGLAFVGGSFAPRGGQNPIEPAKLGVAVIHGPDVANFTEVYAAFDAAGGALEIAAPDALGPAVVELLSNPPRLAAMQRQAMATADGLSGAVARTLAALAALLPGQGA